MNDHELAAALAWQATRPCADCGAPLGDTWMERYDPRADRMDKVHQVCPLTTTGVIQV